MRVGSLEGPVGMAVSRGLLRGYGDRVGDKHFFAFKSVDHMKDKNLTKYTENG